MTAPSSALKLFIADPAILCRWTHKYSDRLIERGVKRVALVRDGVDLVIPPASLEKRTITSSWWHQGKEEVREIVVEPTPTIRRPWSQIIQEDVAHYLGFYSR